MESLLMVVISYVRIIREHNTSYIKIVKSHPESPVNRPGTIWFLSFVGHESYHINWIEEQLIGATR